MGNHNEFVVKLQPAVPEEWLTTVVEYGVSPNEFAAWVLTSIPLDSALARFVGDSDSGESISAAITTPRNSRNHDEQHRLAVGRQHPTWTKDRFMAFLEVVTSIDDMWQSASLLGAYLVLGPMPSSSALKELAGFSEDQAWQQALRVAKQRLTIQARRMEAPGLFRRAKAGPRGERLHPIEPLLYGWLKEWGENDADAEAQKGAFPDPTSWGLQGSSPMTRSE